MIKMDDLDHERSSQDLNMIAQRRRNNRLATVWTHSPRVNYSRIIPKAGMVMDKASGMISPLWQGAGKSFRSAPVLGTMVAGAMDCLWRSDRVFRVSASG